MVPESGIPPPPAALLTAIATGAAGAVNYSFSKPDAAAGGGGASTSSSAGPTTVAPTPNGGASAATNAFNTPLGFNGVERECARDDLLRAFRRLHEHSKRLRVAAQASEGRSIEALAAADTARAALDEMEGKREVFKSRVRQAALRATTVMQWKLAIGMICD